MVPETEAPAVIGVDAESGGVANRPVLDIEDYEESYHVARMYRVFFCAVACPTSSITNLKATTRHLDHVWNDLKQGVEGHETHFWTSGKYKKLERKNEDGT